MTRVTYLPYNEIIPKSIECRVPECENDSWKIEKFEVKNDLSSTIFNMHNPGRTCPEGTYTRLIVKKGWDDCMMSNTPAEIRDHYEFLTNAKGHVLINGLGIGIILEVLLESPKVTKITVVEISEDLIELVAPYFENEKKLEIIHDDAFEYKPPQGIRYDAVWHDIWLNITSDNISEMSKLHRKYGRKTDWQGSWCKAECQRQKRQEYFNFNKNNWLYLYYLKNKIMAKQKWFKVKIVKHTKLLFGNKKENMFHKDMVGETIEVKEHDWQSPYYEVKSGESILKIDCSELSKCEHFAFERITAGSYGLLGNITYLNTGYKKPTINLFPDCFYVNHEMVQVNNNLLKFIETLRKKYK